MSKKYGNSLNAFLEAMGEVSGFFSWPPEGTLGWVAKQMKSSKRDYHRFHNKVNYLKRQGLLEQTEENGKRFLKLTSKGQLQILLAKARIPHRPKIWDKKWRLIIFDIPESHRRKRNHLRRLLRQNGFFKLQASVFINPYPLNRQAVRYLQEAELIDFIRILRVDEMDSDIDLKKKFRLA